MPSTGGAVWTKDEQQMKRKKQPEREEREPEQGVRLELTKRELQKVQGGWSERLVQELGESGRMKV